MRISDIKNKNNIQVIYDRIFFLDFFPPVSIEQQELNFTFVRDYVKKVLAKIHFTIRSDFFFQISVKINGKGKNTGRMYFKVIGKCNFDIYIYNFKRN